MEAAVRRGDYGFRLTPGGLLQGCPDNVELLLRLWIGRELVSEDDLGPGDPGDYDFGAWHVSCHLVAAGGVLELDEGALAWLEISYDPVHDTYYPSFTVETDSGFATSPANSPAARERLAGARVLGFVEGTSLGQISARGVHDPEERFSGNPRQEYDQPADSSREGGKVWEHWCTLRDLRPDESTSQSVLGAYVTLVGLLGELFVAFVGRGRRDYYHPEQLAALVSAGFLSESAANTVTTPRPVPSDAESLLQQAQPAAGLAAAGLLDWGGLPRYYMFSRRIDRWNANPSET